jgi:uncharacterized protein YaaQ
MSTTDLFKKHFNNEGVVGLKHPNIEAFFTELNEQCLAEDIKNKIPIGTTSAAIAANPVLTEVKDGSTIEFLQNFDHFHKGEKKKIYSFTTRPIDELLICTFGYNGRCYDIPTSVIRVTS